MQPDAFAQLLREPPEVRHEIWGLFLEACPSRQEFATLLDELRAFREHADRRCEALQLEVVCGVRGAQVEFDLYAAHGTAYLVEVQSHVKPGDVLSFHRKAQFATQTLQRPFLPLIVALSMEEPAERLRQTLGVRSRVRTRVAS